MVLEEFNGGHFRETTASSGADPGFSLGGGALALLQHQ